MEKRTKTEASGTVTDERLMTALRFLCNVSTTLAADFDVRSSFERVAEAAVPAFFAALVIESDSPDLDPVAVRRGSPGGDHALVAHLTARGETLGTIRARTEAEPGEVDHAVLGDLAARLALALDREARYAKEHRIADTLQRALLPDRLPQAPCMSCSAAYRPGAAEAEVGGDWYDAFDLGDGRTAFSVGDVAGHGLQAAVIMGEVRQAVRAAAVNPKACELVLERANTILNMRSDGAIVTAVFGIYDPQNRRITYATAGHPRPILALADGATFTLPGQGIPLGVERRIASRDWSFTLPPGAIFVLYTDGLIEHSRDPVAGEDELMQAACAEVLAPSDRRAGSIVDRVFSDRRNADDVAILVLESTEQPGPTFHFEFPAVPVGAPIVRHEMSRFAARLKLTRAQRDDLLTAVGEAVANAVEHAYPNDTPGTVSVRAVLNDSDIEVTVRDTGNWKPARKQEERGFGIAIMRALAKRVELRVGQEQTAVRFTIGAA